MTSSADTLQRMRDILQVDPARTAVVTIDCQRGNLDPERASLPVPADQAKRVLASTNTLLGLARDHDIPIIHVSTVFEPSLLATHPFERAMLSLNASFSPNRPSDFSRHKRPGSVEAELMPELDVRDTDLRVDSKRAFDSFNGTPLDRLLRSLERTTLLIAGCNTNTCVLATVFGAYAAGYQAVVIEPCVASAYGDDLHQFALSNIQRRLGWVIDLDTLHAKLAAASTSKALRSPWLETFPEHPMWSNATLMTKSMAHYNAVSMAEIDQVCERLRSRLSEPDAWCEEWAAMGAKLEAIANAEDAAGHPLSAANYRLRAGMYWFTAERFVEPGEHKRTIGQKALTLQQAGLLTRYPEMERVEVPYENTTLPALYLRGHGAAATAPAVVMFNGMDNCKEMSILFAGLEFARRGWHVLAIDGPGQGESLRLRGLHARHDYEVAGAAAYDWLAARPDVDPARIAVMGYSFGGYYAARIAAFDKRYAVGVAFAALHWDLAGWQRQIKQRQDANPGSTAQSNFHFRWVMGEDDADAAIEKASRFSLAEVAHQIDKPFLIVHTETDRVVPVASAHKLYEAITSPRKHLKIFTAETGSAYHCQADNRQVGVDYIADWIGDNLPA